MMQHLFLFVGMNMFEHFVTKEVLAMWTIYLDVAHSMNTDFFIMCYHFFIIYLTSRNRKNAEI